MCIEAQNTAMISLIRRDSTTYSLFRHVCALKPKTLQRFVKFVTILRHIPFYRHECTSLPGGEALAAGASRLEGAPAWICIAGPPSGQSVAVVTGPRPHLLPIARAILLRVTTGGPRSAPPFAAALPPPRTQAAVAAPTWVLAIFV
jgi:hypothetical protein